MGFIFVEFHFYFCFFRVKIEALDCNWLGFTKELLSVPKTDE